MARRRTQYSTTSPNRLDPWQEYMTTIRANALDVIDRCSIKAGDTVPRPNSSPQRVTRSYAAARPDNTMKAAQEENNERS